MYIVACESKLRSVVRSSMHPYSGICVATGLAVVYYDRAAHAFSAGIEYRHCMRHFSQRVYRACHDGRVVYGFATYMYFSLSYHLSYVRNSPVTWDEELFFPSYSGFLRHLQLTTRNLAEKVRTS